MRAPVWLVERFVGGWRLVAVSLLGAALRWIRLDGQAPSIDEGWSIGATLGGLDHALDVVSRDTHPPLYFVLQWMQVHAIGPQLGADRIVAAALGTIAVPITVLVARRFGSERSALLAGLLVALSPLAIFTSRDARPHVAAATLALAATWLLLRALERPSGGRLASYSVAAAAMLLTSYANVMVVIVHGLVVLPRMWTSPWRWLLAFLGIGLLCLPWLLVVAPYSAQAKGILFSDQIETWNRLVELVRISAYALTGGFTLLDEFNPWLTAVVALPVLAGVWWGRVNRSGTGALDGEAGNGKADSRPMGVGILIGLLVATLGLYALTSAIGGQFVARYLTPLVAPVAILYALAVSRLPGRANVLAAAVLLLGWSWTSIDVLVRDKAHRDASEVAAFLAKNVRPSDQVVLDWFSTRGQVVALDPDLWGTSSEGGYDLRGDFEAAASRSGRLWLVADNTMSDRLAVLDAARPSGVDVMIGPRRVLAFPVEPGRPKALGR
ncbi:MAG: hypothetical protein EXR58_01215 [Chloroflexi bacterium]|nr:hypothetical protein [Chloroflexota bacterium]